MSEAIGDFLNRAAERCGFSRDIYTSANFPSTHDKFVVIPFFGDLRGELIFSSFIFPRLLSSVYSGKYVIVATHANRSFLYPEASEVWGLKGEEMIDNMDDKSDCFFGNNDMESQCLRSLNKFFANIQDVDDFKKYYNDGLTDFYFSNFGGGKVWYPSIPAIGQDLVGYLSNSEFPILLSTSSSSIDKDRTNKVVRNIIKKDFYIDLCNSLKGNGFSPVVWRGPNCYDVSQQLVGKAFFMTSRTLSSGVAAARSCGIVLSIFNDLYSLGHLGRVPVLGVHSRNRYFAHNLLETDVLFENNLPPYFSFPPPTGGGEIINSITNKLISIRDKGWVEQKLIGKRVVEIDHLKVRKKRSKNMGFNLFKPPDPDN